MRSQYVLLRIQAIQEELEALKKQNQRLRKR